MTTPFQSLFSLLLLALIAVSMGRAQNQDRTFYKNGYVFNGKTFSKKDFYVHEGTISYNTKSDVNTVVDLKGRYVIPPLADAHTHNFDDLSLFDSIYKAYVEEGTFYIQVLTNHYSSYEAIADSINKLGHLDVAFSHGGLTSTGGHPHALYETRSMGMGWRAMLLPENQEKIRNSRKEAMDAYYLLDDKEDVDEQWGQIIAKSPDILKIYISDFNNRDAELEAGNIGTYGLTKEVAQYVIEKSKEINLKVYAHIETVQDFIWALNNGVTHFAHMPGYGGGYGKKDLNQFIIPDSVLKIAAKNKVVITPTVSFAKYYSRAWNGKEMAVDSTLLKEKQQFLKTQLRRMYDAGITLILGADQNGSTLMEEINDFNDLNVFSNEETLVMLTSTSKYIFPNKKVGHLEEGYEASFLVLEKNPLENINNIKNIAMRVKNGIVLQADH